MYFEENDAKIHEIFQIHTAMNQWSALQLIAYNVVLDVDAG